MEVILKNEGYEVLKFYDSSLAAKEAEKNHDIDLAILDIMMPGIDGFEFAENVKIAPCLDGENVKFVPFYGGDCVKTAK